MLQGAARGCGCKVLLQGAAARLRGLRALWIAVGVPCGLGLGSGAAAWVPLQSAGVGVVRGFCPSGVYGVCFFDIIFTYLRCI